MIGDIVLKFIPLTIAITLIASWWFWFKYRNNIRLQRVVYENTTTALILNGCVFLVALTMRSYGV